MIPQRAELDRLHAELCFGLADPIRIAILYVLHQQPCNVTEITETLQLPQSTVSRHLRILRTAGLVHAVRSGRLVIYSLADARIIQALDLLRGVLSDHVTTSAEVIASTA